MTSKSNVALVLCVLTILLAVSVSGVFIATTNSNNSSSVSTNDSHSSIVVPMESARKMVTAEISSESDDSLGTSEVVSSVASGAFFANSASDPYMGMCIDVQSPTATYRYVVWSDVTQDDSTVREYLVKYKVTENGKARISHIVFSETQLDELIAMSEGKMEFKQIVGKQLIDNKAPLKDLMNFPCTFENGKVYQVYVLATYDIEESTSKVGFIVTSNSQGGGFQLLSMKEIMEMKSTGTWTR